MEWTLEIVLVVLLLATLIQAVRLERALGILKRDRVALEALIAGFNASTRQAESGVDRLKAAADTAGRRIEQQIAESITLKDDLLLLTERGDRVADRLDVLVRAARPLVPEPPQPLGGIAGAASGPASGAANGAASGALFGPPTRTPPPPPAPVRSEAEKSLLQALRLAR
jgi:hypothetical protein